MKERRECVDRQRDWELFNQVKTRFLSPESRGSVDWSSALRRWAWQCRKRRTSGECLGNDDPLEWGPLVRAFQPFQKKSIISFRSRKTATFLKHWQQQREETKQGYAWDHGFLNGMLQEIPWPVATILAIMICLMMPAEARPSKPALRWDMLSKPTSGKSRIRYPAFHHYCILALGVNDCTIILFVFMETRICHE
jgi:hypothetical protein